MRIYFILLTCIVFISCSPQKEEAEFIEISDISFDIYGQDCGGIYITVKKSSNKTDNNKVGHSAFIKPSNDLYKMPDGLFASGQNKLKFYGYFDSIPCIHLMEDGDIPENELFFIYDSIEVKCPYNFFNIERMEFDSITCGRHPSFHERIKVIP